MAGDRRRNSGRVERIGTSDGGGGQYTERRDRKKDQRATSVCMPTKGEQTKQKKRTKVRKPTKCRREKSVWVRFIKMGAMSNGKPVTWAMQCLKFG